MGFIDANIVNHKQKNSKKLSKNVIKYSKKLQEKISCNFFKNFLKKVLT